MDGSWPSPALLESLRRDLAGRAGDLAIVLGSGLGSIADALQDPWAREARDLPGYPESTVAGHRGRLLLGSLGGRGVWVVQGRVHLYEGYSAEEVTRPVRLLHAVGVRTLILTNAAGSLVREVSPGYLVLAADAINLFFRPLARPGPLRAGEGTGGAAAGCSDGGPAGGPEIWRSRERLVDRELVRLAEEAAREEGVPLHSGVLVGSLGPSYETAAEVGAWRRLGGTVASMSTVPEAITARELGMRCLLFSLVSNHATGLSREVLTHEDVIRQARVAAGRLTTLLSALLRKIP